MPLTDEQRLKISIATKGKKHPNYHRTPEGNKKIIESPNSACFKKGLVPWNTGRVMPLEERQRISETEKAIGHAPTDEARKLAAEKIKSTERTLEHRQRLSESLKGHVNSPEARKKMSISHTGVPISKEQHEGLEVSMKRNYQNIDYKNWRIRQICNGVIKAKPTKAEIKLNQYIQELFPNEYKFVGNGDFIIGGKNPDFININGEKKIIEMFGDFWHKGENPQDRIDLFAEYGFGCLVIWESELKNKELVISKLREFHGSFT